MFYPAVKFRLFTIQLFGIRASIVAIAFFVCLASAQTATAQLGFTVTRSDDRNNTCIAGDCSLREAINAANAAPSNDTIGFASGLTTITLTNEIVINNAGELTINGAGADVLTIDGGTGTNRLFYTNQALVYMTGITLTGGNGQGAIASGKGGAIYANRGQWGLFSVHVTGNTASDTGGGVYFNGDGVIANDDGSGYIIDSTFSGNTARNCAGFDNSNSSLLSVWNSTISGNTAANAAGGFCNTSSVADLLNVTVTNNRAAFIGGIFQEGSLFLANTIVAGNIATLGSNPEISVNNGNTITSQGGNLVGDSPGDSSNTIDAVPYHFTDIRDVNPLLGPLQNNGGPTPTHALLVGSPAIDAGYARSFGNDDQRGAGFDRLRDGNGDGKRIVDIGAFEAQTCDPVDTDLDGIGNACDPDDDNDNVPDAQDAFPLNRNESVDTDGDGTGNNADTDDDGDGQLDADETACSSNPIVAASKSPDNEADNIPDCVDADDDNDGVLDTSDAFPFDSSESIDTDRDGVGNNADTDDDGDLQLDVNETACGSNPLLASSKSLDTDGDNSPNCVDTDDDNDNVVDTSDAFPLDRSESVDTDTDGTGNNADTDDDGDGQSDADELACGSSPLDAASKCAAPINIEQCKNGGWRTFIIPRRFENQGDCIQFVNTGK